jgi:NAD(P)-dependent dehydrogenase (short-subunit alcohol dehydrogenase family)
VAEINRRLGRPLASTDKHGQVSYAILNLADFRSVSRFVRDFQKQGALHILVNNAGIGKSSGVTSDQHNDVWQVRRIVIFILLSLFLLFLEFSDSYP